MTHPIQLALGIAVVVILCALLIVVIGPMMTAIKGKQWALLMTTLIILWTPMVAYLILVVGPSRAVDPRHVVRIGALNLGIGIPVFIFIARRLILKGGTEIRPR